MKIISSNSVAMSAILTLCLGSASIGIAAEPMSKPLIDFDDASAARQWLSVNDGVMGGISRGGFRITDDKTLEFSGNLSLENRGGFASIRTRPADLEMDGYDTIALRVKGDGRTYNFNLRTSSSRAAGSYRAPMKTQKNTWQEIRISLNDFEYTAYGRRVRGVEPLRADNVQSVGFTLSDKKAGPFRLEVSWIRAEKAAAANEVAATSRADNSAGSKDIVETAAGAGQFNTLVKAVGAAGLVDTLKGPGPFTVFAPTDDAFAKLPKGTVESLLKLENRAKLVDILTYHVVPGRIVAKQAAELPKADTVQGSSVLISAEDGNVRVAGAKVIKADIDASNGVIHVIDSVIMPKDIVATAEADGQFKTLLAAAKAAGLVNALKGEGPLTVFAPTDDAFAALPDGTVADLLRPENRDRLAAILKYHVVAGEISLGGRRSKTLQGSQLDIRPTGSFRVNEANVLLADIRATNGVVHVVDRVLLPTLSEQSAFRKAMSVIDLAIERGVPLFNNHNPEACAAIYEVAAKSLLDGHPEALDGTARSRLRKALTGIRNENRPDQQAWILRYALDDVYRNLQGKM
jgi:transforming growth factor-beta-induced protein